MEFLVRRHEWSGRPVGLLKPAPRCPVVCIPNAGKHVHALLFREHIACSLSVPMDSHRNLVYEEPAHPLYISYAFGHSWRIHINTEDSNSHMLTQSDESSREWSKCETVSLDRTRGYASVPFHPNPLHRCSSGEHRALHFCSPKITKGEISFVIKIEHSDPTVHNNQCLCPNERVWPAIARLEGVRLIQRFTTENAWIYFPLI